MSEWISVKDKLPNDSMEVLFVENGDVLYGLFKIKCRFYGKYHLNTFWADNTDYDGGDSPSKIENVTHWMPLPEPPND